MRSELLRFLASQRAAPDLAALQEFKFAAVEGHLQVGQSRAEGVKCT